MGWKIDVKPQSEMQQFDNIVEDAEIDTPQINEETFQDDIFDIDSI